MPTQGRNHSQITPEHSEKNRAPGVSIRFDIGQYVPLKYPSSFNASTKPRAFFRTCYVFHLLQREMQKSIYIIITSNNP